MTDINYEDLEKELVAALAAMCLVKSQMEKLEAENARYRKALEKYANPDTHAVDENGNAWYGDYFDYKTARDALKGRE